MKKILTLGLFLGLVASSSLVLAGGLTQGRNDRTKAFSDASFAAQQYEMEQKTAEAAGDDAPPEVILVVSPQFHYTNHNTLSTNTLAPVELKSQGGDSKTGSVGFAFSKIVNETLNLTFAYQYAYTDYSGGVLIPSVNYNAGVRGETDQQIHTNILGLIGDINLKDYGRLNLSLVQGFDNFKGHEQIVDPAGAVVDRRSLNQYRQRVTALMAWYEIDAPLNDCWTLTPFVGWRSLYAHLTNQNTNLSDPAFDGKYNNAHAWIHLSSLGTKLTYTDGPLTLSLRGGVNHRFSQDDLPGFANRAIAPGVVQLGYNVNFDETVGTFGAGVTYAAPDFGLVALNYDGFAGSQTDSHQVSLALIFPF